MLKSIKDHARLKGRTRLLIDVSGSMDTALSRQSEMTRLEAACGLAILAREICEKVEIFTFSNDVAKIPPRRGFALRDAIVASQPHAGTYLGKAVKQVDLRGDRLIVFTDEQSHDKVEVSARPRLHDQRRVLPARRRQRAVAAGGRVLGGRDRVDRGVRGRLSYER